MQRGCAIEIYVQCLGMWSKLLESFGSLHNLPNYRINGVGPGWEEHVPRTELLEE